MYIYLANKNGDIIRKIIGNSLGYIYIYIRINGNIMGYIMVI